MASESQGFTSILPKLFCTHAMLAIIDEVLNQLYLLRKINGWPEPKKTIEDFFYRSIHERFGHEKIEMVVNNDQKTDFGKNCVIVESILTFLLDELKNSETYETFSSIVQGFIKMRKEENDLLKNKHYGEVELNTLQIIFENEGVEFCRKIKMCMSNIGSMKDRIEVSDIRIQTVKQLLR